MNPIGSDYIKTPGNFLHGFRATSRMSREISTHPLYCSLQKKLASIDEGIQSAKHHVVREDIAHGTKRFRYKVISLKTLTDGTVKDLAFLSPLFYFSDLTQDQINSVIAKVNRAVKQVEHFERMLPAKSSNPRPICANSYLSEEELEEKIASLNEKIEKAKGHIAHLEGQMAHRHAHGGAAFRAKTISLKEQVNVAFQRLKDLEKKRDLTQQELDVIEGLYY